MKDAMFYVKRLAEFMGYPFSLEEEKEGAVQKIVKLCSFENLSNLEVNNMVGDRVAYNAFFRKGKVGDWENYLTAHMAECLDQISEQKLGPFGFSFTSSN
ncbi:hypothetical protein L1049_027399 [Liquidambar formosana]|uniref:Sulfotransferase n=1 Tax=Liquidambar formosana TaxID=63359 RepID=A0AAP0RHB5_LIQFO